MAPSGAWEGRGPGMFRGFRPFQLSLARPLGRRFHRLAAPVALPERQLREPPGPLFQPTRSRFFGVMAGGMTWVQTR